MLVHHLLSALFLIMPGNFQTKNEVCLRHENFLWVGYQDAHSNSFQNSLVQLSPKRREDFLSFLSRCP